jgi:4-alpha-glucanotransferase
MNLPRSSGILLHVTSLPGGRLGPQAYAFVDWLRAAGQSWWQVLPLGPPDRDGSPYMASSAFAAWPGLLGKPDAPVSARAVSSFRARESAWIGDWERFAGAGAIEDQVRFDREWGRLRAYAARRGVRLIGDLPIYVAPGSADHLARPELFQRGVVAGAPPDALSAVGQLWGNPLYDWAELRREGYGWWVERMRRTSRLFDLSRVDHFRGFVSYWSVREDSRTAQAGRWRRGPGLALFRAIEREVGPLPLVVEDLGIITPAVEKLRDSLGFPGMVVLQFAYRGRLRNPHRPENHRRDVVVYTGTHDTDTALGWWTSLTPRARAATGLDPAEPHWSLIRAALSSRGSVAILPAQDVLGLDSSSRMNLPGTTGPHNWTWRLEPGQLTPGLAERLRAETRRARRLAPATHAPPGRAARGPGRRT